ncbi:MAG: DNA gyrase subunit A [Clostridia bacterium]
MKNEFVRALGPETFLYKRYRINKLMRKSKDLIKHEKIIRLPISKFVNSKFRDYAVYVLCSRGIPDFYDALTPVQRYIVKNSPTSYIKTLSVVGRCIDAGYHHGNQSLEGAISKLARPFGNAVQLLDGYGFFGTEVSPDPAAARYTQVKLSSTANAILNKYNHLTTREIDGPYDPFWMDVPIGLTMPIVGIAVGYKTTVLPRKLKDIQDFLEGKRKSVKPYFDGFNGTIEKYKEMDKAWLISSIITEEGKRVMIREIPPILKYTSVLKKLDYLINKFENKVRIINNSNTKVNIDIVYLGQSKTDWDELKQYVKKTFSIIVTECPVFIKDKEVLVYDSIEQYLEDYRWQVIRLRQKNAEYQFNKTSFELKFNYAKELFITFMLAKKRSYKEIDVWMKDYEKEICERLERLTSRKFTKDELDATKQLINELKSELREQEKEFKIATKLLNATTDPTLVRGIKSKKNTVNLFDTNDISENKEGICIWDGKDVFENLENEEKIPESDE